VTTSPVFPIAFVLVALATIVPLRDRVQRAVDRLFYRASVDYKTTVGRASERLATLLDRDAVVRHVLATVREVLFIEHASLWERRADGLVLAGGAVAEPGLRTLPGTAPVVAALGGRTRPLSRDEVRESVRLREVRSGVLALFDRLGAELVVPLARGGRPAGLLAVGPKASGGPLSADDVDVLTTLANATAVALATAAAVDDLAAARADLARAERLAEVGELSAAVAHGIRNPLAGIRLAAQLGVESTRPDDPVRENLADVLAEVGKLEARVRGVLDFSRPFEPTLAPTPLAPIVAGLAETLAPGLAVRGVTLRVDVPASLPPARADAALLGQALQELVVNAGEAVASGGTVTVAARQRAGGPGLEIEVADDGPGIPPGMRDRVFQLFMTTKATGTGVGLAVARKIVERHGGTIRVEDAVPHGTRFVLALPAAQGPTT
jgi:signal transduction histidine kinase